MLRNALFTLLLMTFGLSLSASADTLLIDGISSSGTDMPKRGLSMEKVRAQYGDPLYEAKPVGEPPITRWEYNGYVVYFEYKTVLHTITRKPAATAGE